MSDMAIARDFSWWQAHLKRIDQEGITTKEYADREGLSAQQLYSKRKEYKLRAARVQTAVATQPARSSFVPLQVAAGAGPVSCDQAVGCTLVLPSGIRLEMAALPSPTWLAALSSVDLAGGRR